MQEAHIRANEPVVYDDAEPPVAVSHFVHTLTAYKAAIFGACIAVGLLYAIIAGILYLFAPSQKLTSLPFRLDFKGAASGSYPDGLKFSSNEIIATPILLSVYKRNELSRFVTFSEFAKGIFIQETNPEYARLAADYQARITDPRLSPVDRENIQREWDGKLKALDKNEMTINAARHGAVGKIPESMLRKSLNDVLIAWADDAVRQRHVLDYHLPMLKPSVVEPLSNEGANPIVGVLMLRDTAYRIRDLTKAVQAIPGADLIRTQREQYSLEEIRMRLEGVIRYRLEALINAVNLTGNDRAEALAFMEGQLVFDQNQLRALQSQAMAVREAAALYANQKMTSEMKNGRPSAPGSKESQSTSQAAPAETIMPQLSDTFINRLLELTNMSGDLQYRTRLVEEYKQAIDAILPAEEQVNFDQQLIHVIQHPRVGVGSLSMQEASAELAAIRTEIQGLTALTNEVYQNVSQRINPSTELYSVTAPPTTWTDRGISLSRLAAYGILLMLVTLPIAVIFSLIHSRVRHEEAAAEYRHPVTA
jgi:hypothetical protein